MIARNLLRAWRILLSLGAGVPLALAFPELQPAASRMDFACRAALCFARRGTRRSRAVRLSFRRGVLPFLHSLGLHGAAAVRAAAVVAGRRSAGAADPGRIALLRRVHALVAWIARRSTGLAVFAAPFLWVALELGRTRMPDIAFPWNLLGYAASRNLALVQLTSLTGIYGLSLWSSRTTRFWSG